MEVTAEKRPSCCCAASTSPRTSQASLPASPPHASSRGLTRPFFRSPETEKEVEPHPQDRNSRSPLLTRLVSLSLINTRRVRLSTRRYIPSPHFARWIDTAPACTDILSLWWQSRGGRFSASPPAALLVRPRNTENSLTHRRGSLIYDWGRVAFSVCGRARTLVSAAIRLIRSEYELPQISANALSPGSSPSLQYHCGVSSISRIHTSFTSSISRRSCTDPGRCGDGLLNAAHSPRGRWDRELPASPRPATPRGLILLPFTSHTPPFHRLRALPHSHLDKKDGEQHRDPPRCAGYRSRTRRLARTHVRRPGATRRHRTIAIPVPRRRRTQVVSPYPPARLSYPTIFPSRPFQRVSAASRLSRMPAEG